MADLQAAERPRVKAAWVQGRSHRIGSRLLAGLVLMIVPTLALGTIAVQRFDRLAAATSDLSTQNLPAIVAADHLRILFFQQSDLEQLAWANQGLQAPLSAQIDGEMQVLVGLEPPGASRVPPAVSALVKRLIADVAQGDRARNRIASLVSRNRIGDAETQVLIQLMPSLTDELTTSGKLKTLEESRAASTAGQARQESRTATRIVLLLTILCVPLSLMLAVLLTRSILRPLAALLQATAVLASGDLRESPRPRSRDELGQLTDAFDTMRVNLRGTIAVLALERRQTQAIIDACAEGMVLVDHEDRIVQVNPAAEHWTGRLSSDMTGRPWWELCGIVAEPAWAATLLHDAGKRTESQGRECTHYPGNPDEQATCAFCRRAARALESTERASRELLVRLPTGEERWLSVSCASIPGDLTLGGSHMIISLHDVSQLKAVDQLKSDFVAMVSHELRAPVTTVVGAVELLHVLDPEMGAGPQREVLDILAQQTQRLKMVVDEVLQVTRLEAGRLPVRLQSLPLTTFMHTLIDRMRLEWLNVTTPEIRLRGTNIAVWGDPDMLEIVFRNLLDNARKYALPGSPIEIEIRQMQGADHVQIRLSNQGPGISADQLEHLFERFTRGSAAAASWTRGYGLGLYIVRELLRAHNGLITAENLPDGTCFIFTLQTVVAFGAPATQTAMAG